MNSKTKTTTTKKPRASKKTTKSQKDVAQEEPENQLNSVVQQDSNPEPTKVPKKRAPKKTTTPKTVPELVGVKWVSALQEQKSNLSAFCAELYKKSNGKNATFSFEAAIEGVGDDTLSEIFAVFKNQIQEKLSNESINLNDEILEKPTEETEGEPVQTKRKGKKSKIEAQTLKIKSNPLVQFFGFVARLASAVLKIKERNPKCVYGCLKLLHDSMLRFLGYSEFISDVCAACEAYWHQEKPSRELLVPFTMMILLQRANSDSSSSSWILRLSKFKDALTSFDFSDQSTQSIKQHLIACALNKNFIKSSGGISFLVRLFNLENFHQIIEQLNAAFKLAISQDVSLAIQYGEVYWKAWSQSTGIHRITIENVCLQNLFETTSAGEKEPIVEATRQILDWFYRNKKTKGVDEMLMRLTEPFLWRYLRSPNPTVRRNTLHLLVSAFPLQDPEGSKELGEQTLQKQLSILEEMMFDECPEVRVLATSGVCRIMSGYWELLPEQNIRSFLGKLINDSAHDKNSTLVRAAVVEGMSLILDNHLSHSVMKILLPKMSNLFHDTQEIVKVKFVNLLVKVKGIKDIRYFDVIPLEQILGRLGEETGKTQKLLTELLLSAYFPVDQNASIQVSRCIMMLKSNHEAALRFYSEIPTLVSAPAAATFVKYLLKFMIKKISTAAEKLIQKQDPIREPAKKRLSVEKNDNNKEEASSEEQEEEEITIFDMENCLGVMAAIWEKLSQKEKKEQKDKKEREAAFQFLQSQVKDEHLVILYNYFSTPRAHNFVLKMAQFLPGDAVPKYAEKCLLRLGNAKLDPLESQMLFVCLFKWGFSNSVLNLVVRSIELPFTTTSSGKKRSLEEEDDDEDEEVEIDDSPETLLKVKLAFSQLDSILTSQATREGLFGNEEICRDLYIGLTKYFTVTTTEISDPQQLLPFEVLEHSFSLWGRLFIHVHASSETIEKDSDFVKDLVSWLSHVLKPSFSVGPSHPNKRSAEALKEGPQADTFKYSIGQTALKLLAECLALDFCSPSFAKVVLNVTKELINSENPQIQAFKLQDIYARMLRIVNGLEGM